MNDILSQSEIDRLIAEMQEEVGVEPGEVVEVTAAAPSEVIRYDFKQPDKFSRDQIRSLERVFDQLSRSIGGTLSMQTRSRVGVRLLSVEQFGFDQFLDSIPNPCVVAAFTLEPLPGTAMVEMRLDVAFALFDILCGGSGESFHLRQPTEIQLRVFRHLLATMLKRDFPAAWSDLIELHPVMEMMETNSQYLQLMPSKEVGVFASLEVSAGPTVGTINFFIPHSSLEEILPKLHRGLGHAGWIKAGAKDKAALSVSSLGGVRVPIEVELGRASLSFREVLELEENDVILFENSGGEAVVRIAGIPKFTAVPGASRNRLAVKVADIWEGEDDE